MVGGVVESALVLSLLTITRLSRIGERLSLVQAILQSGPDFGARAVVVNNCMGGSVTHNEHDQCESGYIKPSLRWLTRPRGGGKRSNGLAHVSKHSQRMGNSTYPIEHADELAHHNKNAEELARVIKGHSRINDTQYVPQ